MVVPLPWERLLWSGRSRFRVPVLRFFLTDFRLVRVSRLGGRGSRVAELALHDIADVRLTRSRVDRLTGTSTIAVHSRRSADPLMLPGVPKGEQLAALLEVLSGESPRPIDATAVRAALSWEPRTWRPAVPAPLVAGVLVILAVFGVAIGLHGKTSPPAYSPDDPIRPGGDKRTRAEIVRFMQRDVMPWARVALGPIKGGDEHVTCETCHGVNAAAREWEMPAVAALPQPDIRDRGWERWGGSMDAQMRNAIYGYVAESEKQSCAAYMREVVMPGMAVLLHRPPYDFTKPYDENRSRLAFGCYHCHRVK